MSSSKRKRSGPASSIVPFTGAPTAATANAAATSSAASGWVRTGGRRTVSPSLLESAMRPKNSKNCVARTIEYGSTPP